MKIRQQFPVTVENVMGEDERVVTLLGDIGVWAFHNASEKFPNRVYNIGILEQATISVAAGLAKTGLIPVVHTISPFIVERAYEQIKLDFAYQKIGGNFIGVGASYDYSGLGYTHSCPGDIDVLTVIPRVQTLIPGTADEFDSLFKQAYNNEFPTYYRISEEMNNFSYEVKLGHANLIKNGSKATIIAVGPMLQKVLDAVGNEDVAILYYTSVTPFDNELLLENMNDKTIICEPYYSGAIAKTIYEANDGFPSRIYNIGVPKELVTQYGTLDEINEDFGLSVAKLKERIMQIIQ